MTRRVELRPAAERDLDRFAEFLAPLSERAAENCRSWLHESLRKLGDRPFIGRPSAKEGYRELTLKFAKVSYLVRYRVTDDAVIITRIWHGKENRPR